MVGQPSERSASLWTRVDERRLAPEEVNDGSLPARIGRHVVIERCGSGGMGVVYAAYDPELDRKLAIKLIKPRIKDGERAHARMIREAKALARVRHPNVIAIYDVGSFAGQVYIAMEFVSGRRLDHWVASLDPADPERWRSILAVFVEAGRGLAAAHAAGLVHRDFKPANVLVSDDGSVRVLDFGLARAVDPTGDTDVDDEPRSEPAARAAGAGAAEGIDRERETATIDRNPDLDTDVTGEGALVGTPAYMPPERLAGQAGDTRGDQFSFCVALWEALYGRRPFPGKNTEALLVLILGGHVDEPEPERRAAVPEWLHAALLRGLAGLPGDRFPELPALLTALTPPTPARGRGQLALFVAAAAMLAALSWSLSSKRDETRTPLCSGYEARLEGVWDGPRRAALGQAFRASQLRYAERSAGRVIADLDAWTGRWVETRTDACAATYLRGEQSEALLDLRMACLDRRLAELDALIEVLEGGGEAVVERAAETVSSLEGLEGCADPERLRGAPGEPADPELRARVEELERALDRGAALHAAGRFEDALRELGALSGAIEASSWTPLVARHALLMGRARAEEREAEAALASLVESLALAREVGDDRRAAQALVEIVRGLRYAAAYHGELERWIRIAEAEVRRQRDPLLEADLHVAVGRVRWEQGRYADAMAAFEEGLALRRAELGDAHLAVFEARRAIADSLWRMGETEDARALYLEIEGQYREVLGPDHPQLATVANELGAIAWISGDYARALAYYLEALALLERVYGPDDWRLGPLLGNVGACLAMQDQWERALPYFERNVELARSHGQSGGSALGLDNLAEARQVLGDHHGARELYEEAHDLRLRLLGPKHPDTARSLIKLGDLALAEQRWASAREHYERAIDLREGLEVHRDLLGEARWHLAEALAGLGERAAIPELLQGAREDFAASGTSHVERDAAFEASAAALLDGMRE